MHPTKNLFACAMVAAFIAATPGHAQEGLARQDQLQELSVDLSGISTRVKTSVDKTMLSMQNLQDYSGDELTAQAFAVLDTIEVETREVIDKIKVTSPFMSALDDARATVVVLLRKNEREPPSPARDARIAALTTSLASIDEQAQKILAAEGTLTSLLASHAQLRAQLIRDGEVRAVQGFVDDLSSLTDGLEQMANVLAEISDNVVEVPSESSLAAN